MFVACSYQRSDLPSDNALEALLDVNFSNRHAVNSMTQSGDANCIHSGCLIYGRMEQDEVHDWSQLTVESGVKVVIIPCPVAMT